MSRYAALALAALMTAGACRGADTGVQIVARLGTLQYDELRFGVTRSESGAMLVDPATQGRYVGPFRPGDQSVVVYLSDDLAGVFVRCAASALRAGAAVGGGSADVAVERAEIKTAEILMTAAGAGTGGTPPTGNPPARANGEACSVATECSSGNCADGICCESECRMACRSCALSDSKGLCRPVPAGTPDPRGMCEDKGPAKCQTNGLCGVSGDCAVYPAATVCAPAQCADKEEAVVPERTCDGAGKCGEQPKLKCPEPTLCVGGACA